MRFVQVNNSSETFTPTASGAIATHIWEVCKVAAARNPLVITQAGPIPLFADVETACVPPPAVRRLGWKDLPRRFVRRFSGWREAEHRAHARHVVRVVRERRLGKSVFLFHNDPELAVYIKEEFPRSRVFHHFHNPVLAKTRFAKTFSSCVDGVTAVSAYVAREVQRFYGNVPVKVVYNGVDLEKFRPFHRTDAETLTLNFLGRTGIEKAPDLLLRAALTLASEGIPLCVQLLGSNHWGRWEADRYQTELTGLCGQLKHAGVNVRTTGHVPRMDVPKMLAEADVHVLPSRWDEPCALSLLEGMAAGLPVVASRTGGTPEVLGECGLLFGRDNLEELVGQLRVLLTQKQMRHALGNAARRRAEIFTWTRCWEEFSSVIT